MFSKIARYLISTRVFGGNLLDAVSFNSKNLIYLMHMLLGYSEAMIRGPS